LVLEFDAKDSYAFYSFEIQYRGFGTYHNDRKTCYLVIPHPEAVVQTGFDLTLILTWLINFLIICIPFMFIYLIHIIWSLSKYMNVCPKTEEEFITEYPQYRKTNKRHDDFILVLKKSSPGQQLRQLNDTKPG
jgi:hypothetical protein